jgi:thioredoxin reductase (NADPH)
MYDLIIIGAGPAGLSAVIYAQRFKLKTLILSQDTGGTANTAHKVDNYPGLPGLSGFELLTRFKEHAEGLGAQIKLSTVQKITRKNDGFLVQCAKDEFLAKSLIIATGTVRKKLGVIGESEFLGKGVSYCAVCDAFFFKGKTVCVIGDDSHAVQAGVVLSEHAEKIIMITKKESFSAEPIHLESLERCSNVEIIKGVSVKEIIGNAAVEKVLLSDDSDISCQGVFIEIGSVPGFALIKELGLITDEKGRIQVTDTMATNAKGIFAAGDVCTGSDAWEQIVCAASEGALAVRSAFRLIKQK